MTVKEIRKGSMEKRLFELILEVRIDRNEMHLKGNCMSRDSEDAELSASHA